MSKKSRSQGMRQRGARVHCSKCFPSIKWLDTRNETQEDLQVRRDVIIDSKKWFSVCNGAHAQEWEAILSERKVKLKKSRTKSSKSERHGRRRPTHVPAVRFTPGFHIL